MLRRRIIGAAAECFLKYGIKNTSMNFISEILHISKRTLYQSFPSKRDLLKACVTFRLETSRRRIEGRCDSAGPIEAIVCMNYGAYAFSRMFYPAFRKDIPKYPDALVLFEEEYRTPLCKMCYGHFEEAKRMRLIQPESNFEFAFQFLRKPCSRCLPETVTRTGRRKFTPTPFLPIWRVSAPAREESD